MRENASKDSIHYVYICKKLEGADALCEENWPAVEAQIKKEEIDEDNILDDSYDNEEDEELEEGQRIISAHQAATTKEEEDQVV